VIYIYKKSRERERKKKRKRKELLDPSKILFFKKSRQASQR
jgi:hypothetical protein